MTLIDEAREKLEQSYPQARVVGTRFLTDPRDNQPLVILRTHIGEERPRFLYKAGEPLVRLGRNAKHRLLDQLHREVRWARRSEQRKEKQQLKQQEKESPSG